MKHWAIIAGTTRGGYLSKDKGDLPFKSKMDMKMFKNTTTGNIVIMGNTTFATLGNKPLPNRLNIVLTKNKKAKVPEEYKNNLIYVHSVDKAIKVANESDYSNRVLVMGGASVYKAFIEKRIVKTVFLNILKNNFDKDSVLGPKFPMKDLEKDFMLTTVKKVETVLDDDLLEMRVYNAMINKLSYKK